MSSFRNMCVSKMENALNFLKYKFNLVGDWFYQWLSPQFKISTLRTAHFIDSFFGAILKSDQVSKTVKRIWLAYHIFSSTTVLLSSTSYFLLELEVTSYQLIHAFTAITSELTIICTFYIFFRFSQTTDIGKRLEKLHLEITNDTEKKRDWSLELRLILKYLILPVLFLIAKPILLLIFAEDGDIEWKDVALYVYPSPIIKFITSPQQFLAMQLFQVITYAPIPTSTKFFVEIAESVQSEFMFHFQELKKNIESHSKKITSVFEPPVNEQEKSDPEAEPKPNDLVQDQLHLQAKGNDEMTIKMAKFEFEKEFLSCIQRHQTLVSSFVSFRYQLEYGFAVLLVFVYPLLFFCAKKMISSCQENTIDGIVIGGFCLMHLQVLFCCCEMGEKFQEMNTMIYEEVYSVPWYLLDSNMKKNIYILLCYTQQPVQFRSFKIILLNRSTLARLVLILYFVAVLQFMVFDRI